MEDCHCGARRRRRGQWQCMEFASAATARATCRRGGVKQNSSPRLHARASCWIDLRPSPTARASFPLDHALIGGAQPIHGWWAPDVLRYKKKGVGAAGTRPKVRRALNPLYKTLGLRSASRSGVGKHHRAVSLLLPHRRRRSASMEARRTT
jgi:hypothetical protein